MSRKRKTLNAQHALQHAVDLHKSGKVDEAENLYRAVLKQQPENPDALHFLGLLLHRRGDAAAGIESVRCATVAAPGYVDAFNNLGNLLKIAGKFEGAEAAYRRAIALSPNDANAHNNLGLVLKVRGLVSESEAELRRAIEIDDRHVPAYTNLGHLLQRAGRITEAIGFFRTAIVFDPDNSEVPYVLGLAYQAHGDTDKARGVFQAWLERDPGNPIAQHMLGACSAGNEIPARASEAYVRTLFDTTADGFDEHLASLDYRAPQLIAEAFAHAWPRPDGELDVLDAGCGTGLCGTYLRPQARALVGIDLSSGMLRRAKALNVYDQLIEAELTAFLETHAGAYDAIVSADTLCYFGALERVFTAAASALKPAGRLFFTVEKAPESAANGYHLQLHGRYNHAPMYVQRQLECAGFTIETIRDAELRKETGSPVQGLVVTALKLAQGQSHIAQAS